MSLKAIVWVMEDAPVKSHGELVVLYALAERAHDDGRCAWPSQEWIAHRARCSTRTVRNHLKKLEEQGLIQRGDQRFVAHLRSDRRPIVWDLNMSRKRPEKSSARESTAGKSESVRPEDSGTTAGKSESVRPETPFLQTVLEPSVEPSMNQPPVVPQGGHDEAGTEIEAVSDNTPAAPGEGGTSPAGKQKRGTRLDPGFFPSEQTINTVRARFPGMSPQFMEYEHEKFHDHWAQASGRTATKRDWDAAWRNWMRTAVDRLRPAERAQMFGNGPTPQPPAPTTPSKADQYRDIGDMVAAEFAQGGDGQ